MPDPEQHDARSLSALLAEHARTVASERVSLADIADFLGTRSIGAWLLILALPMVLPVPAPGISVLFGMPLMMISAQLALGGRRAWLPVYLPLAMLSGSNTPRESMPPWLATCALIDSDQFLRPRNRPSCAGFRPVEGGERKCRRWN